MENSAINAFLKPTKFLHLLNLSPQAQGHIFLPQKSPTTANLLASNSLNGKTYEEIISWTWKASSFADLISLMCLLILMRQREAGITSSNLNSGHQGVLPNVKKFGTQVFSFFVGKVIQFFPKKERMALLSNPDTLGTISEQKGTPGNRQMLTHRTHTGRCSGIPDAGVWIQTSTVQSQESVM